jgi:hypothetical protein
MSPADSAHQAARMSGPAAARLLSHGWACLDCAGEYGCHAGRRGCEVCGPPRNPVPVRRYWWDDED